MILIAFAATNGMGSGKTHAAEYLRRYHGFTIASFVEPLREIIRKITPDGQYVKTRDRGLAQYLGVEYFRKMVDDDYWIRQWSEQVAWHKDHSPGLLQCRLVTDDLRFFFESDDPRTANELHAVKSFGGLFVNILTPPEKCEENLVSRDGAVNRGISGHSTEHRLDPADPRIDATVVNNGDPVDFQEALDRLVAWICAAPGSDPRERVLGKPTFSAFGVLREVKQPE